MNVNSEYKTKIPFYINRPDGTTRDLYIGTKLRVLGHGSEACAPSIVHLLELDKLEQFSVTESTLVALADQIGTYSSDFDQLDEIPNYEDDTGQSELGC